jgi:hypothetical protein
MGRDCANADTKDREQTAATIVVAKWLRNIVERVVI